MVTTHTSTWRWLECVFFGIFLVAVMLAAAAISAAPSTTTATEPLPAGFDTITVNGVSCIIWQGGGISCNW